MPDPSDPEAQRETPPASEEAEGPSPNRATFSFTWRFLLLLACMSTLLYLDENVFDSAIVRPLTEVSAKLVDLNMNAMGFEVRSHGNSITYQHRSFAIIDECIGLEVHGLFIAAILAVPAAFVLKLRGILMGVPVLMVVNHVRMMTLVILGARSQQALDIGHLYIWPIIVIILAIGLWLSWIRIISDDPRFLA